MMLLLAVLCMSALPLRAEVGADGSFSYGYPIELPPAEDE